MISAYSSSDDEASSHRFNDRLDGAKELFEKQQEARESKDEAFLEGNNKAAAAESRTNIGWFRVDLDDEDTKDIAIDMDIYEPTLLIARYEHFFPLELDGNLTDE